MPDDRQRQHAHGIQLFDQQAGALEQQAQRAQQPQQEQRGSPQAAEQAQRQSPQPSQALNQGTIPRNSKSERRAAPDSETTSGHRAGRA